MYEVVAMYYRIELGERFRQRKSKKLEKESTKPLKEGCIMNFDRDDCMGCKFAIPMITDGGGAVMKCRRFPPQVYLVCGDEYQSFPDATYRCGEYKEPAEKLQAEFDKTRPPGITLPQDVLYPMCVCGHGLNHHNGQGECQVSDHTASTPLYCGCKKFAYRVQNTEPRWALCVCGHPISSHVAGKEICLDPTCSCDEAAIMIRKPQED